MKRKVAMMALLLGFCICFTGCSSSVTQKLDPRGQIEKAIQGFEQIPGGVVEYQMNFEAPSGSLPVSWENFAENRVEITFLRRGVDVDYESFLYRQGHYIDGTKRMAGVNYIWMPGEDWMESGTQAEPESNLTVDGRRLFPTESIFLTLPPAEDVQKYEVLTEEDATLYKLSFAPMFLDELNVLNMEGCVSTERTLTYKVSPEGYLEGTVLEDKGIVPVDGQDQPWKSTVSNTLVKTGVEDSDWHTTLPFYEWEIDSDNFAENDE